MIRNASSTCSCSSRWPLLAKSGKTPSTLFLPRYSWNLKVFRPTHRSNVQATPVATCCVAHESLVFGNWIYQRTHNNQQPIWLGIKKQKWYPWSSIPNIEPIFDRYTNPSLDWCPISRKPTCFDHEFSRLNRFRGRAPTFVVKSRIAMWTVNQETMCIYIYIYIYIYRQH